MAPQSGRTTQRLGAQTGPVTHSPKASRGLLSPEMINPHAAAPQAMTPCSQPPSVPNVPSLFPPSPPLGPDAVVTSSRRPSPTNPLSHPASACLWCVPPSDTAHNLSSFVPFAGTHTPSTWRLKCFLLCCTHCTHTLQQR